MVVAGILALAPAGAVATTPIYKCLDAHLGLIYTDQRCANGEQIDIQAGIADPDAAERLQNARDQIERRAAARASEQRRVEAKNQLAALARHDRQQEREAARAAADGTADDETTQWYRAYLPAYLPAYHPARGRHHPRRTAAPGSLPHDPLFAPRS